MSANRDNQLAAAKGSAEGWRHHSDKMRRGKEVAQAHARWFEQNIKDAQTEIEKPFRGDESLAERLRRVAVILDRRPPVIKIIPKKSL